ncbi:mitochondrial seryl-tRNA synthetase [Calycina marina]|uniref:Mitochondrial seryl-tRNA synthetase n=1 Tax=Calycina marina TaxID=1763456 RepID=A0A9P8CFQ7_9HELO|nr:mitochondrial seryl-tRNA synthetase [Calycina marina]
MFRRQLLRKPIFLPLKSKIHSSPSSRFGSSTTKESRRRAQIGRLLSRLPRFLQPYTSTLRTAPTSSIISFLILHEITAVVPLLGLASLFHFGGYLPESWTEARYIREGVEKFGRYFGRKGWFGFTPASTGGEAKVAVVGGEVRQGDAEELKSEWIEQVGSRWGVSEGSGRILVEFATAYAITKVFLPARILVSVWATPWFARVVLSKLGGGFRRVFVRTPKAP